MQVLWEHFPGEPAKNSTMEDGTNRRACGDIPANWISTMNTAATRLAYAKFALIARCFLGLAAFLLLPVLLVAQDTPVGVPGTQVATEETPAAATNSDALRKAAQN